MNIFKNKVVLITGGTGSLGRGLLKRITEAKEIRILSRSESGQLPLMREYSKVKFVLGDIVDLQIVKDSVRDVDIVIHAAAFKFLNIAEQQVRQCVLTNIIGSLNVIAAVKAEESVQICLGISTDKVAYARNVYGCTKHIMEKLFYEANRNSKTKFCCVRYGNVLGTTGSVSTIWRDQLDKNKPLTVTDKRMTRFFFLIHDAISLIFYALEHTKGGETFIQKMPAHNIYEMAKKISDDVIVTGIRPGEKLYETLIADYEGEEYTSDKSDDSKKIVTIYA